MKKRLLLHLPLAEEKKVKSNIDLHIVGKIDLDALTKESKPVKKEEPKEKKEKAKEAVKEKEPVESTICKGRA